MVGNIVGVVTCVEKLHRMTVAVHPNRCVVVNIAVAADVRNPLFCVRHDRWWK